MQESVLTIGRGTLCLTYPLGICVPSGHNQPHSSNVQFLACINCVCVESDSNVCISAFPRSDSPSEREQPKSRATDNNPKKTIRTRTPLFSFQHNFIHSKLPFHTKLFLNFSQR